MTMVTVVNKYWDTALLLTVTHYEKTRNSPKLSQGNHFFLRPFTDIHIDIQLTGHCHQFIKRNSLD